MHNDNGAAQEEMDTATNVLTEAIDGLVKA